jgi:hypothetical protein
LGPDVGFGELVTRMITANRTERARREKATGERAPQPDEDSARGGQHPR